MKNRKSLSSNHRKFCLYSLLNLQQLLQIAALFLSFYPFILDYAFQRWLFFLQRIFLRCQFSLRLKLLFLILDISFKLTFWNLFLCKINCITRSPAYFFCQPLIKLKKIDSLSSPQNNQFFISRDIESSRNLSYYENTCCWFWLKRGLKLHLSPS